MTKTNKNFLMLILSFVLIGCTLIISLVSPISAKAESLPPISTMREGVFDTTNYVVDRELQYGSEVKENALRLYEDSFIEITGPTGAYLMSSYGGFTYLTSEYAVPADAPVEISTCRGEDSKGAYVDIFFTEEALITMFGTSEEFMVYAYDVYVIEKEMIELPDGPATVPENPDEELNENMNVQISGENYLIIAGSVLLLAVGIGCVVRLFKKRK